MFTVLPTTFFFVLSFSVRGLIGGVLSSACHPTGSSEASKTDRRGPDGIAFPPGAPVLLPPLPPVSSASVVLEPLCAPAMVLIAGQFCLNPRHECLRWLEDPAKLPYARCAQFLEPAVCAGESIPLRFCMDREEYVPAGETLPAGNVSWTQARTTCEQNGKRLCGEREWVFACEGEAMRPYPTGFVRAPELCNIDQADLTTNDGKLRDGRIPPDTKPACLSPFGVLHLVGNADEWVILDRPYYSEKNGGRKMMSGLKGGWWGPVRNRCRPTTVEHDEHFHELQTGFRCCNEARF